MSKAHFTPVATAYARSLIELAEGEAEPIGQDLRSLATVVAENPAFRNFLSNPGVSEAERSELLNRVLGDGGQTPRLLINFLGVLNSKGRLGLLSEIADAYDDLLDEKLGKIEVDVTVAQKLSPEQLEQVRQRISQALKKDAVVHQYVDESIIGGLILRVEDQLIDASVRYQLEAMKQQMLSAK
jgi:F-type H+-transporting ATPase subunit delta